MDQLIGLVIGLALVYIGVKLTVKMVKILGIGICIYFIVCFVSRLS